MPPQKKIDKLEISDNRSLDSYFNPIISNTNVNDISEGAILDKKPVNITSLEIIQPKNDVILSRENVLNNLKNQKICYNINEIKNKVEQLTENELAEIFKIIKNNNEKYSTNKNGIFINISTLRKVTLLELSNFLYFCENNDKIFDIEEEERAKYKDIIIDS
jgi:hypothetical protein